MDVRLQPSACNVLKNTTNKKKERRIFGAGRGDERRAENTGVPQGGETQSRGVLKLLLSQESSGARGASGRRPRARPLPPPPGPCGHRWAPRVVGELRGAAATRAGERGSRPAALPGAEPRGPGPRRPAEPRGPGRERGRGGPRRCGVSGAGAGVGAAAMFSFFVNRSHLHTTISIHKKNNAIRPAGRARRLRGRPPLGARGAGCGARRRGPAGRLRPGPLGSRASPCGAALVDTVMWEISAGEVLGARDRSIHKVPGRPFRRGACTPRAAGRPAGRARRRRGGLGGAGRPPAAGTEGAAAGPGLS